MKYLALIIVAVCLSSLSSVAQFATEMVEYHPAPGQLINTDGAGSIDAAGSVVGSLNGMVSLGAFGGYVVYGFDQPVKNDPANPYGVDFVIFGNVQTDWAEPGIVMVMKDENNNGKPDDTWFELAGSDYFFSTTKHRSAVTYYNPLFAGGTDVPWASADLGSGFVYSNSFHKQDFFPSEQFFGGIVQESAKVKGTLMADQVDLSLPAQVKCYHRRFGYADNNLRRSANFNQPDNPCTETIEGCGGDAMDISWAVDESGNYVDVDQIDFVKIYTGVLSNAGWCGEISTEVCGLADVAPNSSVKGQEDCVVINRPIGKFFAGSSLPLEAISFKKGRRSTTQQVEWSVDNGEIATVQPNGLLQFRNSGTVNVTASFANDRSVTASQTIEVVDPVKIEILLTSPVISIDEEVEINTRVTDRKGAVISGLKIGWAIQNNEVISFVEKNGRYYLKGLAEGTSTISLYLSGLPAITCSTAITVMTGSEQKEVFVTVKDENSTIVPRNKYTISNFNLTSFVDKATGSYGMDQLSGITVAHAIAGVFNELGFAGDFRFRDDEKGGGKLYLWKVPKGDPANVELVYGYGGYTANPSFTRTWVVMLNNTQLINGFDKQLLKNGDELIVYHVSDITNDWKVSCFLANKTEVTVNDTLEVYSTELTCMKNDEGKVLIKSSSPIKYQQVWVNEKEAFFNGDPVVTDETGTAALRFSEAGVKRVATGIDEMMVTVENPLAVAALKNITRSKVWPQPAHTLLNIEITTPSAADVKIIDLAGRCVAEHHFSKENRFSLSVAGIQPGLYLLQLSTDLGISNHKISIQ
jgi:hypothetical protein